MEITNTEPLIDIGPAISINSDENPVSVNDLDASDINFRPTKELSQENLVRSDLNSLVNSQNFWSKFVLQASKGDGHCLLYSIITSAVSQIGITVELVKLKQSITSEIYQNFKTYLPAIEGNSFNVLENQMKEYIDDKVYDSSFGDIVPVVCSKVLNIGLCIFSSRDNRYRHELVFYDDSQPIIYIYKKSDHYDAIVYSETSCPT